MVNEIEEKVRWKAREENGSRRGNSGSRRVKHVED